MTQRDSQRSKVYLAETPLHWSSPQLSDQEAWAFFRKVQESAYVRRKYNPPHIHLDYGRGGGKAHRWYQDRWGDVHHRAVTLGVWARRKSVILHELAHHYAGLGHGHDWRFCEVYLDLVRHFLGQTEHDRLKESFKHNKVRFRKPATRTMTPEQKADATERLAAARAVRDANRRAEREAAREALQGFRHEAASAAGGE